MIAIIAKGEMGDVGSQTLQLLILCLHSGRVNTSRCLGMFEIISKNDPRDKRREIEE